MKFWIDLQEPLRSRLGDYVSAGALCRRGYPKNASPRDDGYSSSLDEVHFMVRLQANDVSILRNPVACAQEELQVRRQMYVVFENRGDCRLTGNDLLPDFEVAEEASDFSGKPFARYRAAADECFNLAGGKASSIDSGPAHKLNAYAIELASDVRETPRASVKVDEEGHHAKSATPARDERDRTADASCPLDRRHPHAYGASVPAILHDCRPSVGFAQLFLSYRRSRRRHHFGRQPYFTQGPDRSARQNWQLCSLL